MARRWLLPQTAARTAVTRETLENMLRKYISCDWGGESCWRHHLLAHALYISSASSKHPFSRGIIISFFQNHPWAQVAIWLKLRSTHTRFTGTDGPHPRDEMNLKKEIQNYYPNIRIIVLTVTSGIGAEGKPYKNSPMHRLAVDLPALKPVLIRDRQYNKCLVPFNLQNQWEKFTFD